MRSIFYMPPLHHVSGGMRVITQLANHLHHAGYETIMAVSAKLPDGLELDEQIRIAAFANLKLWPEDRLIVPEGWTNALAPGLAARCSCCLFVQNWAYLHGHLPRDVHWFNLPVKMLAISRPVAIFIKETTGVTSSIISPALDSRIFHSSQDMNFAKAGKDRVRIAWMPRKNKGIARQIFDILQSMLALHGIPFPDLVEINNLNPVEVGELMRSCHIFLATGFPEGFGLPPLEAMSCGCIVGGFTGFGGWDYMRQLMDEAPFNKPAFPLPTVPWGANGLYVADGDVLGAAKAIMKIVRIVMKEDDLRSLLVNNGMQTAKWYSVERQRIQLLKIWADEKFWNDRQRIS